MFPLWTSVTLSRSLSIAYWMAALTRRCVPSWLTGLMPMPAVSGKRTFLKRSGKASAKQLLELLAVVRAVLELDAGVDVFGVLAEDDHVGQLRPGDRRGDALEPLHRAQADVEVEDLPQRDVDRADAAADGRGERALDADQVGLRNASSVASGSHSPVWSNAFWPARTSFQAIFFLPPYAFSTAASMTNCDARQMSGPVPSPSMNGMIGLSGVWRAAGLHREGLAVGHGVVSLWEQGRWGWSGRRFSMG